MWEHRGSKVLITRAMYAEMGYTGESKKNKLKFKELLQRHDLHFEEVDYEWPCGHPEFDKEVASLNAKSRIQQRWIVLDLNVFKEALMLLQTPTGNRNHNTLYLCTEWILLNSSHLISIPCMQEELRELFQDSSSPCSS